MKPPITAPLVVQSFHSTDSSSGRSEEHTSELQSLRHLVCRLLLEKKKQQRYPPLPPATRLPFRAPARTQISPPSCAPYHGPPGSQVLAHAACVQRHSQLSVLVAQCI